MTRELLPDFYLADDVVENFSDVIVGVAALSSSRIWYDARARVESYRKPSQRPGIWRVFGKRTHSGFRRHHEFAACNLRNFHQEMFSTFHAVNILEAAH